MNRLRKHQILLCFLCYSSSENPVNFPPLDVVTPIEETSFPLLQTMHNGGAWDGTKELYLGLDSEDDEHLHTKSRKIYQSRLDVAHRYSIS